MQKCCVAFQKRQAVISEEKIADGNSVEMVELITEKSSSGGSLTSRVLCEFQSTGNLTYIKTCRKGW